MTKKNLLIILFAVLFTLPAAYAADLYTIDPVHSGIGFKVKHMVISTVPGKFNTFEGQIMFDPNDITKSSVEFTIQTASIDTDNENRDNHLQSADFFDVEKYPTITFKSTKVEQAGDGYMLHGNFTMRGVTKEISFPFTYNGQITDGQGNIRAGFDAELKINRMDYGVSWDKTLDTGGLIVGNEVKIEVHIEAIHQPK